MRIMTVGLVGCGGIAQKHVQAAAKSDRVRIAACVDVIEGKAQAFAQKHGIERAYNSMAEMLTVDGVDLVLLATYPANHLAEIREAIQLGAKAILCEKALAMNGDEAETIRQLIAESGVFLMQGLMYRHHPQIQRAREIIESDTLGPVGYVHAYFSAPKAGKPDPNDWRTRPELGGGTLAAKGCYLIDALCAFCGGTPTEVFCHATWHREGPFDVGQSGTILFDNDVVGHFEANHRTAWREEMTIAGPRGWLRIPHAVVTTNQPRTLELSLGGAFEMSAPKLETLNFDVMDSYQAQLENVHACLFEGGTPGVPLDDSLRNLHVTGALLASAASGRKETVRRGETTRLTYAV